MLTAILPIENQAYFFKVVGPVATVDAHEKELNAFFEKIAVGPDKKPKWQLPEGWKEAPGSDMRFATITVPADGKPLEISITALPWSGTPDDMLRNVNRWRNQLQLRPIAAQQIDEYIHELKAGDHTLTVVDLKGHFASSGMSPPFAGGATPPSGPVAKNSSPGLPSGSLPPGHPPIDSASSSNPAEPAEAPSTANTGTTTKFTAPTDWKPLPAGGLRKAAFAIGDEQRGALVTLISFPASEGPMIADPLQNVNRWRREVGLAEVKQDELSKATASIKIDGNVATLVRAIPDATQSSESHSNRATIAAMVESGGQLWFVKLTGDRSVVTAQESEFNKFLESMHFASDRGATDGNK